MPSQDSLETMNSANPSKHCARSYALEKLEKSEIGRLHRSFLSAARLFSTHGQHKSYTIFFSSGYTFRRRVGSMRRARERNMPLACFPATINVGAVLRPFPPSWLRAHRATGYP